MKVLDVELGTSSYPIVITDNIEEMGRFVDLKESKCLIITDSNLYSLHLNALCSKVKKYFKEVLVYCFKAGEESKTLIEATGIYTFLVEHNFSRDDVIMAFGGGVTGDLGGFVAATYMRGIKYIQVPTSILAQVDSSVGGKTAVNLLKTKNIVGAFYQPILVYVNCSFLQTLPEREIKSGLVEVLVHAIIKDYALFEYIEENLYRILGLDLDIFEELIARNCKIKRDVVQRDERDQGERAILNFGHTYGHAIESAYDYKFRHGECVAIGILGACYLSEQILGLDASVTKRIRRILEGMQVLPDIHDCDRETVLTFLLRDKKFIDGKVSFILLTDIGSVKKYEITDFQIVKSVLDRLIDLK